MERTVGVADGVLMGFKHAPVYNRHVRHARESQWYKLVGDYVKQMSASLARPTECDVHKYKQTQTHSRRRVISYTHTRTFTRT